MPKLSDFKDSKYLTKDDVNPPLLLTMTGIHQENVAMQGQPEELKWILTFKEHAKGLVCNSINAQLIAGATGSEDTDGWMGKQIVLFVDPTITFGGKVTGGVRARAPKNRVQTPPPAPAPVTETESDDVPF